MDFQIEKHLNIININNNILTVKDLLKQINYTFDEYFIDKFWNSIQNNIWVYIDNEMLIWMGYSNYDIKKGKLSYSKILESNFEENIEYKHINNKEFTKTNRSEIESESFVIIIIIIVVDFCILGIQN